MLRNWNSTKTALLLPRTKNKTLHFTYTHSSARLATIPCVLQHVLLAKHHHHHNKSTITSRVDRKACAFRVLASEFDGETTSIQSTTRTKGIVGRELQYSRDQADGADYTKNVGWVANTTKSSKRKEQKEDSSSRRGTVESIVPLFYQVIHVFRASRKHNRRSSTSTSTRTKRTW